MIWRKIARVSNTDRRERQLLCSFRSLEFTVPSLEFQCVLGFFVYKLLNRTPWGPKKDNDSSKLKRKKYQYHDRFWNLFYYQLMHIMLKNTELLKHSKITFTQCTTHTPYRSQYAAIALTTPCTSFMQILLTKCVIFSQALSVAPWRWFLCKPKHVGA